MSAWCLEREGESEVVIAINGHDLSSKENPWASKALLACRSLTGRSAATAVECHPRLAKRPVVLDVDWPIDMPMPAVNSA